MRITDKPFYRHSAEGLEHIQAGRFHDAVIAYGLAAEADPRLSNPHQWTGTAHWCSASPHEAIESWNIAISKPYQSRTLEPLLLFFSGLRFPEFYDPFDGFKILKERIHHPRTTRVEKMLGAVILDEADEDQLRANIEAIGVKRSPRAVGKPGQRREGAKTDAEFFLGIRALMAGDMDEYTRRMRLCWERKQPRKLLCYLAGYEAGLFPTCEPAQS